MGSAKLGIVRSPSSSVRTSFRPGDFQVGPKFGLGVFAAFLARFRGEVGPWTHILAPHWSKLCFFGSMRCHGHVGACVEARRHVAWRGSHQAHDTMWSYFVHITFIRALMSTNDISGSIVSMSPSQWYNPMYCLWWCHIHAINALALIYIISRVFWPVLHQKLETPTLVEIVSIKPYPSVDDHFLFISYRCWWQKSGI
jgi:hypothetical protein